MFGIASHMPHRRQFWYRVVEDGGDYRYDCFTVLHHLEDLAVDAAEDYHGNHDGWEARWPLTFAIYETEDGPEIGRFTVEREYEPSFSASPVRSRREMTPEHQELIEEIVAQTRLTCSCSADAARRAAMVALASIGAVEGRVLGILERTASDATDEITVAEAARRISLAFHEFRTGADECKECSTESSPACS